jgi:hypothetical protein
MQNLLRFGQIIVLLNTLLICKIDGPCSKLLAEIHLISFTAPSCNLRKCPRSLLLRRLKAGESNGETQCNFKTASLGFEPRQRDPESLVLPLHHEARS